MHDGFGVGRCGWKMGVSRWGEHARGQISNWRKKGRKYYTEIEAYQSELRGWIADRVEGGGGEDLFSTYGMYKERMTEVDYWGGDG